MTDTIQLQQAIRANDVADFCDLIWANAADAAPRSRPSDRARSGLAAPRIDRLSQERKNG